MEKRKKIFLALLALLLLAFSARLLPTALSDLPYNIDGFPLVKISECVIEECHITINFQSDLIEYNSKMPAFSLLIAFFSLMLGVEPMRIVSFVVPLIGVTSIVTIYLIAFRITQSRYVALFSGLFLALNGFYVYFTTAIVKEVLSLALIPLILYLFNERDEHRKRALSLLFLLLMPLVHHLGTIVVIPMVLFLATSSNYIAYKRRALCKGKVILDILSIGVVIAFTVLYYTYVDLKEKFFLTMNDYALFISLSIILAVITARASAGWRLKSYKTFIPFLLLFLSFCMLALNHYKRLFAGTVLTKAEFLYAMIPFFFLMFIILAGLIMMGTKKNRFRPLVFSMLFAPLTVMLFGIFKGLDPITFNLVYRAFDFLDFAFAIFAGIGIVFLIKAMSKEKVKELIGLAFIALCLLTLPIAYNTEENFGVQDVTYEYEFKAMNWLEGRTESKVGTNQRLADILNPYFGVKCDNTLPFRIIYNKDYGSELLLIEDKWKDEGAQMYPAEPVIIKEKRFDSILEKNDLVYVSGSEDKIYVVSVNFKRSLLK